MNGAEANRWLAWVVAACVALSAAHGAAQGAHGGSVRADAGYDVLVREALAEYGLGNFAEARALFDRAHALRPSARTLRGLGITAFELQRYVQAISELEAALADRRHALTAQQRQDVQQTLSKARRFVGRVKLELVPSNATVFVDGRQVTGSDLLLDLGTHQLEARASGHQDRSLKLVIEGGEERVERIELAPVDMRVPNGAVAHGSGSGSLTAGDAAEDDRSVTGKWWFWTGIGAVVVGGTAVALAVALGGDGGRESPFEGTAGSVTAP